MNKRAMVIFGVMLALILSLQVVLVFKINKINEDMLSSDNFASNRIDIITSNIHELRNMLEEMSEDK